MGDQLTNFIFGGDMLRDKLITLCVAPNLPKVEVKRDKIICEVTSLKYLYEPAVYAFKKIIETAIDEEGCEEVSFDASGLPEDKVELVSDIVNAIGFTCEKRGKDKFFVMGSFTRSSQYESFEDGTSTLTFKFADDMAKDIYDLAQSGKNEIDLVDIAIFHTSKVRERMVGKWEGATSAEK